MKKFLLVTTIVALGLAPAFAQMGPRGGGHGPNLGGPMGKLFAANPTFSANMEFQTSGGQMGTITMPGKISFDSGKSRFEMNMSQMSGLTMPAGAADQMKAMGMDTMISISRPDLKMAYAVYPGLNSYAEMPLKDSTSAVSPDDYKVETAELGKETIDGHNCVKNQVTVTDKDSNKTESTVWNAKDLKDFPIKVVTGEGSQTNTMLFKNISTTKPESSLFEPPTGYTKYDNVQAMMQAEMMKKMGGGMGMPPAHK